MSSNIIMYRSWFVLFRPKITRLDFKKSRLTLVVVEDDDQVRILHSNDDKHTHKHNVPNSVWLVCICKGTGAGAHLCVPAGQLQELQTPVEVCCGEPRLLPATAADNRKDQPQRLHATRVSFQIQVTVKSVES